jgi:sterol desaturase/sphingolipid hydroxylase (fatty acid hydroxylase superfamily)
MDLNDWLISNEPAMRLGFFVGVFALMAIWEIAAPRRVLSAPKAPRWANNIGLVAFNTLLLRLLLPTAALGVAAYVQDHGWGLLNYLELGIVASTLIAVVLLDLVIYLQHVMVHALPVLWRLHRVHHADLDYDLTTGARFHPLEILLSMLIKFAAIVALGPPLVAVVIFEIVLNAMAMFNHGNVRLPTGADRVLRLLLVTPDMHRVHHSIEDDETNSNFGFNLSCWDRLFGTYRAQPRAGHEGMTIGIAGFRDPAQVLRLPGMLALPFRGGTGSYPINRRQWAARDGDRPGDA